MSKAKIVILLGRPGAGKGTQAEMLGKELGFVHLSTGEILRSAIRNGTEWGSRARTFVDSGKLVPDDLIVGLVGERLRILINSAHGVICDGFPRTVAQAEALSRAFTEFGVGTPIVVELRLLDSRAAERIVGRSKDAGDSTRTDDRQEVVASRMVVFEAETRPVIDYYESQGILRSVDASGTREEVFDRVKEACGIPKLL